jgi:hypothetical protein
MAAAVASAAAVAAAAAAAAPATPQPPPAAAEMQDAAAGNSAAVTAAAAAAATGVSTAAGGFVWGRPTATAKDYARPEQMPRNVPMHTWWQEHAGELLYPGARITNMDAIFKLTSIWNDHNMPNAAFSDMLGVMTDFLLPKVSASFGGVLQCLPLFA